MNFSVWCVLLFAAVVAVLSTLRPIAVHYHLVDHPCIRKRHNGAVPLIGGIGIYICFAFFAWLMQPNFPALKELLLGGLILLVVGTTDDYCGLSPRTRLLTQVLAVLVPVYAGGVRIQEVGSILPSDVAVRLDWLSVPFTVFATVGVVNAFNLIDGADGLAGSLVVLALIALAIVAKLADADPLNQMSTLLAVAVAGFLCLNWPRYRPSVQYKVFLGDGGSTLLGYWVAFLLIAATQGSHKVMSPVVAPWLIAVPLQDTIVVVARRLARKSSPFRADRSHLHHLIMGSKVSEHSTVLIILAKASVYAAIGLTLSLLSVSDANVLVVFLIVSAIYLYWNNYAWSHRCFLGREVCRRHGRDRRVIDERRRHAEMGACQVLDGRDYRCQERRAGQRRSGWDVARVPDGRAMADVTADPLTALAGGQEKRYG